MPTIGNYLLLEKIAVTGKSIVYRAQKGNETGTVIVKVLNAIYPKPAEIARFKQEYELIKKLAIPGLIKVNDIIELDDGFAIIEEDVQGISLKSVILSKRLSLREMLPIAIALAETLGNLHLQNIVHKDIKPHNIIINEKEGITTLTDFGIANELINKNEDIYNDDIIEGTLPYMSPEQTGRMNRTVDYRTDLYSLGVTLYEMVTGTLPFTERDPLQLIHSHIASEALPPATIDPAIPTVISDIIMKLLSKGAEDRYQNSFSLMRDLENCREQLANNGTIEPFAPAEHDLSIKFNIPQKLFGREKEIGTLLAAFERIVAHRSQMTLVTGKPGIGKTTIINEIQKTVAVKQGYFISGKFDQFTRNMPYSAIIQAFQFLVHHLLTETEETIRRWKENLLQKLGSNAALIIEIIPAIELITGKQPSVPPLEAGESQNRFQYVLKNFIMACTEERPMVLFLDDLQWTDGASLSLIKTIISDAEIHNLLLIGAYRDNEVDDSHRLILTIDEIKKQGGTIETVSVGPLSLTSVEQLLNHFLRCGNERASELGILVERKTSGNPFFIYQFLKTLHDERVLELEPRTGWTWDMRKIEALRVTDNVVELMAETLARLPEEVRHVLEIGACIGNRFDLETVVTVFGGSLDRTLFLLNGAIAEGLIVPHGNLYTFYHDRIQEAAYSFLHEEAKAKLHYVIGNLALRDTKEIELNERVLYIINQLNAGIGLIETPEERSRLAELNLLGGRKAKSSAAYEPALKYLTVGIDLLGEAGWRLHYATTLSLHEEAAEAAYLLANYGDMERLTDEIVHNSRHLLDRVNAFQSKMQSLLAQGRQQEAIANGRAILKEMGCTFPEKTTITHIAYNLMKTKYALMGKTLDTMLALPVITDPAVLAKMRILTRLASIAWWKDVNLFVLICFQFIQIICRYGNCAYAPSSYVAYGMIINIIGETDAAYKFGCMSIDLMRRLQLKIEEPRTYFIMNTFLRHWKEQVRDTLAQLKAGYQAGLETGDFEFAGYNMVVYFTHSFYGGLGLQKVRREFNTYHEGIRKLKQKSSMDMLLILIQSLSNLMDPTDAPCSFNGPYFNEEMFSAIVERDDKSSIFDFFNYKLMLCYLFKKYHAALEHANSVERYLDSSLGTYTSVTFFFYDSLSRLAVCGDSSGSERRRLLRTVKRRQKKMKKWAADVPMNHLHKHLLINAEIARIQGRSLLAEELYGKAIAKAREHGFIQEEAIACECAANYYLARELNDIAGTYMLKAYHCYAQWGAVTKVKHLEENHRKLLGHASSLRKKARDLVDDSEGTLTPTTSTGMTSKTLDLSTVIKSSQALSSEIDLGRLLENIMRISIENAGAQKGILLLENEDTNQLSIEAESDIGGTIQILKSTPLEMNAGLSSAMVHYVHKTREPLVLQNASAEGLFTGDPYVIANRPKSIICSPITHQRKVAGILYLENNLTTGAFTPERLEILRLLSSQAAISIENARLLVHRENAARLSMEMQIAEDIQTALLPKKPLIRGHEIIAYMKTATEVGGDYYDVINTESRDWVVIGDVSGHGVTAGLVMMMVQTLLNDLLTESPDIQPSQLLARVNRTITRNISKLGQDKYMTITVFACHEDGNIFYSGLHQDILIYRKETGRVEVVPTKGMWLGIMDDISVDNRDESIRLQDGDMILLYTDGITEAWRKGSIKNYRKIDEDMYGIHRLVDLFAELGNAPLDAVRDAILADLENYSCHDDITLVVMRKTQVS